MSKGQTDLLSWPVKCLLSLLFLFGHFSCSPLRSPPFCLLLSLASPRLYPVTATPSSSSPSSSPAKLHPVSNPPDTPKAPIQYVALTKRLKKSKNRYEVPKCNHPKVPPPPPPPKQLPNPQNFLPIQLVLNKRVHKLSFSSKCNSS
ncbi:hypothetical protein EJ06DRAFT_332756 [Trichodelitschia bisporula]|uniref:Uncharacterized protein n=1 Tax=Trichodelitschia bisporula TaxID=703511 RepID=A0A6G1I2F8_9PEZI|nr:hypothetical protein EJ06DRAFT_332756 [Trichodelitschia bisporula]